MTDTDDMDTSNPESDRRRQFYIPDPPQKPHFIRENHWSKFSSKLSAKLNSSKTGFDVDLFDPSDITACRLGPPSNAPDYHVFLEKYGLQCMEAAGFINYKDTEIGDKIKGRKVYGNPSQDPDLQKRIHLILRRTKWIDITDHQYNLMTPALLLASAVLDDPVTLNYFYALAMLAMPSASMDTVGHDTPGLQADCDIMRLPDVLDDNSQRATFLKLDLMKLYIQDWGFDDYILNSYAYTQRTTDASGDYEPASRPDTFCSKIRIKSAFMKVLEYLEDPNDDRMNDLIDDIQTFAGIHTSRRAPISLVSSRFRTYFFLAAIIIHELAHAFSFAYYGCSDPDPYQYQDPWLPGNRCNEQGLALENYVFGGLIRPIVIYIPPMSQMWRVLQGAAAPFGLYTTRQWDVWMSNGEPWCHVMDEDRQTAADTPPDRVYAVPQEWTQWIFSNDLWTDQVLRYGLQAIKVPKVQKWEILNRYEGIGQHGTGEERWSSTQNRVKAPTWDEFYGDDDDEYFDILDDEEMS